MNILERKLAMDQASSNDQALTALKLHSKNTFKDSDIKQPIAQVIRLYPGQTENPLAKGEIRHLSIPAPSNGLQGLL